MGHSCRAHSLYETSSKSHAARLQDERFVRDFLQKSRVKFQKRAFRTRVPPKVTRQVSKTSSFVRDFLQKSHFKSPKRAFRTRLPQKLTCQSLQNERFARDFLQKSSGNTRRTHTSRSPAKQFRDSSPSKRHPLTRQSQCDSDIHLYHNSQPPDSLRLPRIFPRPHV